MPSLDSWLYIKIQVLFFVLLALVLAAFLAP